MITSNGLILDKNNPLVAGATYAWLGLLNPNNRSLVFPDGKNTRNGIIVGDAPWIETPYGPGIACDDGKYIDLSANVRLGHNFSVAIAYLYRYDATTNGSDTESGVLYAQGKTGVELYHSTVLGFNTDFVTAQLSYTLPTAPVRGQLFTAVLTSYAGNAGTGFPTIYLNGAYVIGGGSRSDNWSFQGTTTTALGTAFTGTGANKEYGRHTILAALIYDGKHGNPVLSAQNARDFDTAARQRFAPLFIKGLKTEYNLASPSVITNETISLQTLIFTETTSETHVATPYISETLTFTGTVTETHIVSPSIDQTLTFTQTLSPGHVVFPNIDQTLTFTQTLNFIHISSPTIDQTLLLTQSIGLNIISYSTFDQLLTLTQTYADIHLGLTDSADFLTFVQSIDVNIDSNSSFTDDLVLTESLELNIESNQIIDQTLTFTETMEVGIISHQIIDQTLTFTEISTGDREINPVVDQTLIFNQTIDLLIIRNRLIVQYLFFTQPIDVVDIGLQTVTSTLVFEGFAAKVLPEEIDQTISFTQTIENTSGVPGTINQTLTFTPTITLERIINLRVSNNIFFTQNIPLNRTTNLSMIQYIGANDIIIFEDSGPELFGTFIYIPPYGFTQNISETLSKGIISTLALTQIIDGYLVKSVTSEFEMNSLVYPNIVLNIPILSDFGIAQAIQLNIIHNETITSSPIFTQTVTGFRVHGVSSNLVFTQTVSQTLSKGVSNNLSFTQTIFNNFSRSLSISQSLRFIGTVSTNRSQSYLVQNTFAISQHCSAYKVHNLSVDSTLVFTSDVAREVYSIPISDTIDFTQSIEVSHVIPLEVISNLNFAENIINNTAISLHVISTLEFFPSYQRYVGNVVFNVPDLLVTKANQNFTTLQYGSETVVLPNPRFGDGEGNTGLFTIRRGWRGKSYTYVKKTDFRKITYTFDLGIEKALEVKTFITANNSNVITLTNWKGEIWMVYLTKNPVEFNHAGRYSNDGPYDSNNDRERVEVTLEFEGILLGVPNYDQPSNPVVLQ